ncbi:MAG: energy-coupling factor transporter ATPase [Chloroflexi bacterium]|nr:energy-coupling factor transporter ATPase [Chloroflexota bacterium]
MLEISDLQYSYRGGSGQQFPALRGVTLTVRPGEYLALVGANGSGKSTLARHINALLLPDSGRVLVEGRDTRQRHEWRAIRQAAGMVFQDPEAQFVATTVEEDVAFGPENLGLSSAEIQQRVAQSLALTGMAAFAARPPHLLSVGQKQRVAIAGVLALEPHILIFDEATAMLDPQGRAMVLEIMEQLHRQGRTIITITHFMEEAARAGRMVVLHQGQVVADGAPREIFSQAETLASWELRPPAMVALSIALALEPVGMTAAEVAAALNRRSDGRTSDATSTIAPVAPAIAPLEAPGGAAMIQARDLSYTYLVGTPLAYTALHNLQLEIFRGRSMGLMGQTGSGKSTLLQHFNGLIRPQTGQLQVLGEDLGRARLDLRRLRQRVGLVFQQPEKQIFEPVVGDDIAFGPRQMRLDRATVRQRVQQAMAAVGLDFESFKDRPTFALSGGERRRVALAGVLALQPEVLLLDEPTAGLDPATRVELLEFLDQLRRTGTTLVVTSHQQEDLAVLVDDLALLAQGQVLLQGSLRQILGQVDRLEQIGLVPHPFSQLLRLLRQSGWAVDTQALTLAEVVATVQHGLRHGSAPLAHHSSVTESANGQHPAL